MFENRCMGRWKYRYVITAGWHKIEKYEQAKGIPALENVWRLFVKDMTKEFFIIGKGVADFGVLCLDMRNTMLKSFKNFLIDTKKEKYTIDGRRIRRCWGRENSIATNYVDITRIFIEEVFENGIELNIEFESPNQKIYGAVFAKIAHTEKITYDWKCFFDDIQKSIKKGYREELQRLYKQYFDYCITTYLKTNRAILAKCGWVHDEFTKAFIPFAFLLGLYEADVLQVERDLFDGKFGRKSDIPNDKEFYSFNNNLGELFAILFKDACMLKVFAYSIHAILWDYLNGYNKRGLGTQEVANGDCIFSLCIYGKNPAASKILANLLANFFNINHKNWATIQRKYHVSSTSVSHNKFDRLFLYKSVPIIITSKTNCFTKASSIIKKLHQKREKLWFHCYPVYISTSPVLADEIINCCSDSIAIELCSMDYSNFNVIHYQFCYLLYQFIIYLTIDRTDENSRKMHLNREDIQYMNMSIFHLFERPELTEEWVDTHMPEICLCSTMDCFCHYLKHTPLCGYEKKLREFSESCFLPVQQGKDQKGSSEYVQQETNYMCFLHEAISKNLKSKNESWLWEGKEKRGEKEQCYYLEHKKGYDIFIEVLKAYSIPVVLKNEFNKLLKTNHVLKMPQSGSSNTMKRKGICVYVLLKDRLDAFQHKGENDMR